MLFHTRMPFHNSHACFYPPAVLYPNAVPNSNALQVDRPAAAAGFSTAAVGGYTNSAVNKVHGDYTANGAPKRVLQLSLPSQSGSFKSPPMSEQEALAVVSGGRFMILNVWRSISTEVRPASSANTFCRFIMGNLLFTVVYCLGRPHKCSRCRCRCRCLRAATSTSSSKYCHNIDFVRRAP